MSVMSTLTKQISNFLNNSNGKTTSINELLKGLDHNHHSDDNLFHDGNNSSNDSAFYDFDVASTRSPAQNIILGAAYCLLVLVALFGNTMVCHVVIRNRRMHTVTNLFIVNLAFSGILVTALNIPLMLVRSILQEWPLGSFMCHLVNFILMSSVYVSTFTLMVIALDRHQVIMYPLRPRISLPVGALIVALIWIVAIGLSMPFAIYARVEDVNLLVSTKRRCRSRYPEPSDLFEQRLTLATILLQYIIPLSIITIAYIRIGLRLWARSALGHCTTEQRTHRNKSKRKTIKMLITVVVVFAMCWMPLNLYHILTDFHPDNELFRYNSIAFSVCHWIAISSMCYNPFIYCWLNDNFRTEVKSIFSCCFPTAPVVYPGMDADGLTTKDSSRGPDVTVLRQKSTETIRSSSTKSYKRDTNGEDVDNVVLYQLLNYDKKDRCRVFCKKHENGAHEADFELRPCKSADSRDVSPDDSIFVEHPKCLEDDVAV